MYFSFNPYNSDIYMAFKSNDELWLLYVMSI
jgi:hypothetical protein